MDNKKQISKYKIIKELQKTSTSRTLKVFQNQTIFTLTMLRLKPINEIDSNSFKKYTNRLLTKLKIYQSINHKNIQHILDVFIHQQEKGTCIGIVGQHRGEDLFDFIGTQTYKDRDKSLELMIDITEGIIYQMFNPRTIWKDNYGNNNYKIGFRSFRQISNHNQEWNYYTAPEIYNKEQYQISADIWSLGVLFLEIMTGLIFQNEAVDEKHYPFNCIDDFPTKEQFQLVPNGYARSLIKQMLIKQPKKRLKIHQIRKKLEYLNLNVIDKDFQEEIEEKVDTVNFLISLNWLGQTGVKAQKRQKRKLNVKWFQQRKIMVKRVFNLERKIKIKIGFEEKNKIMIIYMETDGLQEITMREFEYDDLPLKVIHFFEDMTMFVDGIAKLSENDCSLTSSGELQLRFNSQELPQWSDQSKIQYIKRLKLMIKLYSLKLQSYELQQKMIQMQTIVLKKEVQNISNNYNYSVQNQAQIQKQLTQFYFFKSQTCLNSNESNLMKLLKIHLQELKAKKQQRSSQSQIFLLSYYLKIGFILQKLQRYEEAYCLYEQFYNYLISFYGSVVKINSVDRSIQDFVYILLESGFKCSLICDKEKYTNWQQRIQRMLQLNEGKNIILKVFVALVFFYYKRKQQNYCQDFFYRAVSLLDTTLPKIDRYMIDTYLDLAHCYFCRVKHCEQELIKIYTQVVMFLRENPQSWQIYIEKVIKHLLLVTDDQEKQRPNVDKRNDKINIWIQEFLPEYTSWFYGI